MMVHVRQLVPQAAIVLAVAVGAWMMIVEPTVRDVGQLEQEIAAARGQTGAFSEVSLQQATARMSRVESRLETIEARNEVGRNSSALYDRIMALAARHDVLVRHLQPGSDGAPRGEDELQVRRLEMSLEGGYEPMASFLEAIAGLDGWMRPASLTVSAVQRDGKPVVSVRFVCDWLIFPTAPVRRAMQETIDAP